MKIRLTWKTLAGINVIEVCNLLSEESDVFVGNTGIVIENFMEVVAKEGIVVFEDSHGIFGLDPKQIIKIEKLE